MAEVWDYIDDDCTDLEGTDPTAPTSDPPWTKVLLLGPPNEYISDDGDVFAAPPGTFRFHTDTQAGQTGILETDVGSLTDDVTAEMRIMVKQNSNKPLATAIRLAIYTGKHLPGFQLRPQGIGDVFDVWYFRDGVGNVDSGLNVTLPVDEWHTLRLVVDGSGASPNSNLYFDNVLLGALTAGRILASFEGLIQLIMQSDAAGTNEWDMDHIKITNGQQPPPLPGVGGDPYDL